MSDNLTQTTERFLALDLNTQRATLAQRYEQEGKHDMAERARKKAKALRAWSTATAVRPIHGHSDIETPEEIYSHFLQWSLRAGTKPERAHVFAQDRANTHRKKMLGNFDHLTESAAHFMAAMLRQKRMPAGAKRWVAQQCLEAWLPHMRQGEQAEVVATLRKCTSAQLGPDLVAMIAQAPADV